MANNEMFIKDPLDPDFGRISYDYLPTGVAPPATPNLNQVLNAGNQALGENIDAQGGDVLCDTLKCISIQPVAFPIVDTIQVNGNLGLVPTTKIAFADNAVITCNLDNYPNEKKVIETTNENTKERMVCKSYQSITYLYSRSKPANLFYGEKAVQSG